MKKLYIVFLSLVMVLTASMLSACGGGSESSEEPAEEVAVEESSEEEALADGAKYGYTGTDPIELAAYKYMCEKIGKDYESGEHTIAYAQIINEDVTNPEDVLLKGSFWVENYNLEGDTLKCVSGGNHPGCFHLKQNEDGSYEVTSFDAVADGGSFESSAKEIFGDSYEDFMKAYSDDEAKDTARYDAVSAYINGNEIPATKFQDEGWDPIELHL